MRWKFCTAEARGSNCYCILRDGHAGPHVSTYDDGTAIQWEA